MERKIKQQVRGYRTKNGAGVSLVRVLGNQTVQEYDPILMLDEIKDTLITHGHPRAFLGATCYAFALDYLLRKDTILEYGELVSAVIDGQQSWGAFPNPDVFGQWLGAAKQYAGFDYAQEWEKDRSNMLYQLNSSSLP